MPLTTMDDGFDEVPTEMVSLNLSGNSSLGPVLVRLNPALTTTGGIMERLNATPGTLDLPPFTATGPGEQFLRCVLRNRITGWNGAA